MNQSTRGIVLRYYPYSESSIIVKIFTESFGLQSYIVKGLRSKTSKTKLSLFQPLTLIEFVAHHKENKSLHHLREPRVEYHFHSIQTDPIKRSILFFLAELLYKSIRIEASDKQLFQWIHNAVTWFDLSDGKQQNYHLVFMFQLSRFLGFYPKYNPADRVLYFDLQEGKFCKEQPHHPQYVSGALVKKLADLCQSNIENSVVIKIDINERRQILDHLIIYYQLHLPGFGEMKSVEVLKTIN